MQSQSEKNKEIYKKEIYLCECSTLSHIVGSEIYHDEHSNDFYVHLLLNRWLGFFKRLVVAFSFLFKLKDANRPYDSIMLSKEDRRKLRDMLNESLDLENRGE